MSEWVHVFWEYNRLSLLSFIIYQLCSEKEWIWYFDKDENSDYKQHKHSIKSEICAYIFEKCIVWKEAYEYILKHISTFTEQRWDHFDERKIHRSFTMQSVYDIYDKVIFDDYINVNLIDIEKFVKYKNDAVCSQVRYIVNWEDKNIILTYWEFWEIFITKFGKNDSEV